jgi:hypothetical protein
MRRSMRLESIVEASGQSFKRKGTMHKIIAPSLAPQKPGEAKIVKLDKMSDEQ